MDSLTEKLDQILSDPGSVKRIMDTVSALGFDSMNDAVESPPQDLPVRLSTALQHTQEKEHRQQALIRALIPYLSPGKQRRLERAMQVAKLSNLAAITFASQNSPFEKEDANV